MPRQELMNWDSRNSRWKRFFHGVQYIVTAKELGVPNHLRSNKENSVVLANDWWRATEAQIIIKCESERPHSDFIQALKDRAQIAGSLGLHDDRVMIESRISEIRGLRADDSPGLSPSTQKRVEAARLLGVIIPEDTDPSAIEMIFGDGRIWNERKKRTKTIDVERTIGASSKRYVSRKAEESIDGTRSPDGADNIRGRIEKFVNFCGADTPIDAINFDLWERWYNWCKGQIVKRQKSPTEGLASATTKSLFGTSRSFVKWLHNSKLLPELPNNLNDKTYKLGSTSREIQTYSNDEISKILKSCNGQLKLHLLLMLNCGMTQIDISDLRHSEIDLKEGTITRRRSKEKNTETVPVVRYVLWKATLTELKKHLSNDPIYALETKSKRRWVRKITLPNGKLKKSDNIATLWANHRKVQPLCKSLKSIRKTSATRLKNNPEFAVCRFLFLGHSERTIADIHYADISKETFDASVVWLGKQYGIR